MEFYYSDTDKDVLIIKADGGLNSDNADKFVDELAALIDAGQTKIVVDCSRLNNITSYGLGGQTWPLQLSWDRNARRFADWLLRIRS